MPVESSQITIIIQREAVTIAGVTFADSPTCEELQRVLPTTSPRVFRQGPGYLPALVFDELGLVVRYHEATRTVALVDIFFATSQKRDQPAAPFNGTVILNKQSLKRPVLMNTLELAGDFAFDDNPVPAASGSHGGQIGVSIVPKFEYVAVINFGWQVE